MVLREGAEASIPVRLARRLRRASVYRRVGPGCQPIWFAAAVSSYANGRLVLEQ